MKQDDSIRCLQLKKIYYCEPPKYLVAKKFDCKIIYDSTYLTHHFETLKTHVARAMKA